MKKMMIFAATAIIFSSNTMMAFADSSASKLDYLKDINSTFKSNISTSAFDTKLERKLSVGTVTNNDEARKLLQASYSANPFFNTMTIKSSSSDFTVNLQSSSKYDNAQIVAVAQKWVNEVVKEGMTDREKIKAIHDKIITETTYDKNAGKEAHVAGGVAIDKRAVCDGYSRMFVIMTELVDIPAIQVTSTVMEHAFNLVYVDGKWLLIDVTYDDVKVNGKETIRYDYFLIDPTSSKKHKYDSGSTGLTLNEYIEIGNYLVA